MRMCTLTYDDYYYSVIKFLASCGLGGNSIFQQVRNMANYECLATKDVIHVGNNITVNVQGTVYLVVSTKTRCFVKGKINASRILEQTSVELRISHSSNQICTEWSGAFHYNKDLACLEGLDDVLIDVDVRQTNASTILWIEIKGGHLQIDCREDQFSDHPLAGESSMILIFILGGVVVALVAGAIVIVVFIKMKFCKRSDLNELDTNEKVIPTTTLNPQDGVQYGEKNQRQSKDSEKQTFDLMSNCAISNTNTIETSLPVQDGNYSLVSASDFEGGNDKVKESNIDTIETSLPVQDGIYSLINASDFEGKNDGVKDKCFDKENSAEYITKQSDAVNTVTNQIIGEVTGDVYASVCKRDNLEDSRITGPKGDIYTTVSTTLKTK
ncbi:uncharacterized protein LOC133182974 [Saccostrea echinata]|uniref:uncharacterized protein LOC133182974 n=1 Tax=Saccostrea echinata TaxID=191078 RepID=UPI002A819087|nr:uncharacterized protein LOC133182974 [Saccostrea echinata]